MLSEVTKRVFDSFQTFLVIWAVVILVNQIFIFGACFEIYCLIAALPHTSVVAALVVYFFNSSDDKKADQSTRIEEESATDVSQPYRKLRPKQGVSEESQVRETSGTYNARNSMNSESTTSCPKCGASMKIRMATRGAYSGKQFLGCSTYPQCKGIVNLN